MISLNPTLPPHTDPATITLAAQLLAAVSDPQSTAAQLQKLADATDALRVSHANAVAAKAEADASIAKLASAEADRAALADSVSEHERNVTALAVASEANAQRSRQLDQREKSIEAQASDLMRRIQAFDARLKNWRDQLAG